MKKVCYINDLQIKGNKLNIICPFAKISIAKIVIYCSQKPDKNRNTTILLLHFIPFLFMFLTDGEIDSLKLNNFTGRYLKICS